MNALRSGIRRLVSGARRAGQADRSVDIVDPRNVAVQVNAGRPGSASAASSQQTVIRQGKGGHTVRSSRVTESKTHHTGGNDGRSEDLDA